MKKLALNVSLAVVLIIMVGCSALDKLKNGDSTKPAFDLSGSWEVVATSSSPAHTGAVSYIEFTAVQQGDGSISTTAQEFVLVNGAANVLGNCFGVAPGNPQGNIFVTVGADNIQGTFTETDPQGDSAPFNINAPLSNSTSFSGTYSPMQTSGVIPGDCVDGGSYVATKTSSLAGNYSGMLTYPDNAQEMVSLTVTDDASRNVSISGAATGGGSDDGPISGSGLATGNLIERFGLSTTTAGDPAWKSYGMFVWWNAASRKLYFVDDHGYEYGYLTRQ